MSIWSHIVIETYCFGKEKDGVYPCGRTCPDYFCIERKAKCPHLGYVEASERDAAEFVPLHLILWDRLTNWYILIWDKVTWWAWDSLWFNRRKTVAFFKSITVLDKNDPIMVEENKIERLQQRQFRRWIRSRDGDAKDEISMDDLIKARDILDAASVPKEHRMVGYLDENGQPTYEELRNEEDAQPETRHEEDTTTGEYYRKAILEAGAYNGDSDRTESGAGGTTDVTD